jgi:spore coat protein U-like protein
MMARHLGLSAAAIPLVLLFSSRADAAPNCSISTTSVSFGTYDVFSASVVDSTGSVTYNCRGNAVNITVTLSRGQSSNFTPRTLLKSGEVLSYNLYRDAARMTIWGDGTGGTSVYSDPSPPNNTNITLTVYGRIPATQDVSAGSYTDTVTATINF